MSRSIFLQVDILFLLLLSGCSARAAATPSPSTATSQVSAPRTLTVFAAASLTEAFTEIGRQFEADHQGLKIIFNFAGSQQLAQQIAQGAPFELFASASEKEIQAVVQAGQVSENSAQKFVSNQLMVIFPADNPANLQVIQDLARPGVKLVLAAGEVPAGRYALEFLDKASQDPAFGNSFGEDVLKNVVSYEENVRSVLSKVILGEADAGIVYASDLSKANAQRTGSLEIPAALNVTGSYYIAPAANGSNLELANTFITFVLSPAGQDILASYGFLTSK